jgi:hypothetical protein
MADARAHNGHAETKGEGNQGNAARLVIPAGGFEVPRRSNNPTSFRLNGRRSPSRW